MLDNGQRFPTLTGPAVDGSTRRIPDDLATADGGWSVLLFYRGYW